MADDFTLIRGINQKIAARLQEAGIRTYEKLAAMTPNEIVARIGAASGITAESVVKKDWIGQAARLADAISQSDEANGKAGSELHAANYVIELFLDERNRVRRTKVRHIQSEEEDTWDKWNEARLVDFFAGRPELNIPKPKQTALLTKPAQPSFEPESEAPSIALSGASPAASAHAAEAAPAHAAEATPSPAAPETVAPEPEQKTTTSIGGPRLRTLEIIPAEFNVPCRSFAGNQPFTVRLDLDLAEIMSLHTEPFDYTAIVQAKSLSGGRQQAMTREEGTIEPNDNFALDLKVSTLPPGVYRLNAAVTLSQRIADVPQQQRFSTSFEGGLFEIF